MAENIAEEMAQSEAYDSEQCNPACSQKIKSQFAVAEAGRAMTSSAGSIDSASSLVKPSATPSTAGNPLAGGAGGRSFPRPLD